MGIKGKKGKMPICEDFRFLPLLNNYAAVKHAVFRKNFWRASQVDSVNYFSRDKWLNKATAQLAISKAAEIMRILELVYNLMQKCKMTAFWKVWNRPLWPFGLWPCGLSSLDETLHAFQVVRKICLATI